METNAEVIKFRFEPNHNSQEVIDRVSPGDLVFCMGESNVTDKGPLLVIGKGNTLHYIEIYCLTDDNTRNGIFTWVICRLR